MSEWVNKSSQQKDGEPESKSLPKLQNKTFHPQENKSKTQKTMKQIDTIKTKSTFTLLFTSKTTL